MKKIFFAFIVALVLFACNPDSGVKQTTKTVTQNSVGTPVLTLSNGTKWKADSITNHNVVNLKTIADSFHISSFPTITQYRLLGNELSNSLNIMAKQCKMTGPDHEVLHHWLEPILKETSELKNVSDTAKGRSIFNNLDKNINNYHAYFQ